METKINNEINNNEINNDKSANNEEILKAFFNANKKLNEISTEKFKKRIKKTKKVLKKLIKDVLEFRIIEERKTSKYMMEIIEIITNKTINTDGLIEELRETLNNERELKKQINKINLQGDKK